MWPEDDVDFAHDPVIGDSLSMAEIAAAGACGDSIYAAVADSGRPSSVNVPKVEYPERRRKRPCASFPDHPQVVETPPNDPPELLSRQDLLAQSTARGFEAVSRRLKRLENRPSELQLLENAGQQKLI